MNMTNPRSSMRTRMFILQSLLVLLFTYYSSLAPTLVISDNNEPPHSPNMKTTLIPPCTQDNLLHPDRFVINHPARQNLFLNCNQFNYTIITPWFHWFTIIHTFVRFESGPVCFFPLSESYLHSPVNSRTVSTSLPSPLPLSLSHSSSTQPAFNAYRLILHQLIRILMNVHVFC